MRAIDPLFVILPDFFPTEKTLARQISGDQNRNIDHHHLLTTILEKVDIQPLDISSLHLTVIDAIYQTTPLALTLEISITDFKLGVIKVAF